LERIRIKIELLRTNEQRERGFGAKIQKDISVFDFIFSYPMINSR